MVLENRLGPEPRIHGLQRLTHIVTQHRKVVGLVCTGATTRLDCQKSDVWRTYGSDPRERFQVEDEGKPRKRQINLATA